MFRLEDEYVRSHPEETLKALGKIYEQCGISGLAEISECWMDGIASAKVSTDTQFSVSKVMQWNKRNGQESYVDLIPEKDAEDYWYNRCTTFRP